MVIPYCLAKRLVFLTNKVRLLQNSITINLKWMFVRLPSPLSNKSILHCCKFIFNNSHLSSFIRAYITLVFHTLIHNIPFHRSAFPSYRTDPIQVNMFSSTKQPWGMNGKRLNLLFYGKKIYLKCHYFIAFGIRLLYWMCSLGFW